MGSNVPPGCLNWGSEMSPPSKLTKWGPTSPHSEGPDAIDKMGSNVRGVWGGVCCGTRAPLRVLGELLRSAVGHAGPCDFSLYSCSASLCGFAAWLLALVWPRRLVLVCSNSLEPVWHRHLVPVYFSVLELAAETVWSLCGCVVWLRHF